MVFTSFLFERKNHTSRGIIVALLSFRYLVLGKRPIFNSARARTSAPFPSSLLLLFLLMHHHPQNKHRKDEVSSSFSGSESKQREIGPRGPKVPVTLPCRYIIGASLFYFSQNLKKYNMYPTRRHRFLRGTKTRDDKHALR